MCRMVHNIVNGWWDCQRKCQWKCSTHLIGGKGASRKCFDRMNKIRRKHPYDKELIKSSWKIESIFLGTKWILFRVLFFFSYLYCYYFPCYCFIDIGIAPSAFTSFFPISPSHCFLPRYYNQLFDTDIWCHWSFNVLRDPDVEKNAMKVLVERSWES